MGLVRGNLADIDRSLESAKTVVVRYRLMIDDLKREVARLQTALPSWLGTLRWGKVPGAGLLVTQPFDSVDKLARMHTPMLFRHGTADRVVPHTMSDELFAARQGQSIHVGNHLHTTPLGKT